MLAARGLLVVPDVVMEGIFTKNREGMNPLPVARAPEPVGRIEPAKR